MQPGSLEEPSKQNGGIGGNSGGNLNEGRTSVNNRGRYQLITCDQCAFLMEDVGNEGNLVWSVHKLYPLFKTAL